MKTHHYLVRFIQILLSCYFCLWRSVQTSCCFFVEKSRWLLSAIVIIIFIIIIIIIIIIIPQGEFVDDCRLNANQACVR